MGRIAGVSPEETKERLVDAAARVFELKGYEGATVAQIAREAGVSTGAIYAHYGSKADLLVDALRAHGERATSALFPPGNRFGAPDILVALGERLTSRDPGDGALLFEALLASRRDAELAQVLANLLADRQGVLATVVEGGQAEGLLDPDVPPGVAARFALMLGFGSILLGELDLDPVDQAEWISFVRRIVGSFTKGGRP